MLAKVVLKKILAENPRQKLTALALVFIVYVVMLSGIFSYFHSEDVATNRLNSQVGSVALHEPAWDSGGQKMAQTSEPGMEIPKDPYAYNDGQVDEYIRLKMTVQLGDFDGTGKTDTYKTNYDDNTGKTGATTDAAKANRRLNTILSVIKYESAKDTFTSLFDWDNTGNAIGERTVSGCNNTKYKMIPGEDSENTDTSRVFYFYYTDGDAGDNMKAVRPGESTGCLFHRLDIPVYKADYLGVFDQEYSIIIQAEAVPAANCTDGSAVYDVKGKFE